jgi:hypothetical protein
MVRDVKRTIEREGAEIRQFLMPTLSAGRNHPRQAGRGAERIVRVGRRRPRATGRLPALAPRRLHCARYDKRTTDPLARHLSFHSVPMDQRSTIQARFRLR